MPSAAARDAVVWPVEAESCVGLGVFKLGMEEHEAVSFLPGLGERVEIGLASWMCSRLRLVRTLPELRLRARAGEEAEVVDGREEEAEVGRCLRALLVEVEEEAEDEEQEAEEGKEEGRTFSTASPPKSRDFGDASAWMEKRDLREAALPGVIGVVLRAPRRAPLRGPAERGVAARRRRPLPLALPAEAWARTELGLMLPRTRGEAGAPAGGSMLPRSSARDVITAEGRHGALLYVAGRAARFNVYFLGRGRVRKRLDW